MFKKKKNFFLSTYNSLWPFLLIFQLHHLFDFVFFSILVKSFLLPVVVSNNGLSNQSLIFGTPFFFLSLSSRHSFSSWRLLAEAVPLTTHREVEAAIKSILIRTFIAPQPKAKLSGRENSDFERQRERRILNWPPRLSATHCTTPAQKQTPSSNRSSPGRESWPDCTKRNSTLNND